MENMKLYNLARQVPDEARKPIEAGRLKGMTDINPMWRMKRLTEMFGPCGVGWWYEITGKEIIDDAETKQRAAFVDVMLYYVDPESGTVSHGIPGTGGSSFVAQERNGPYLSDECYKMALTDAISVAAKALGVAADVYYIRDRDKYTAAPPESAPKKASPVPAKAPEKAPEAPKTVSAPADIPSISYICADCGKRIVPYRFANGREMGVMEIAERSKKAYGETLCMGCANVRAKARAAEKEAANA